MILRDYSLKSESTQAELEMLWAGQEGKGAGRTVTVADDVDRCVELERCVRQQEQEEPLQV